MADEPGPDPVVSDVVGLAEYQELKNEHYVPFNFGASNNPAKNHFYSDKDVYPELPALFSTQGAQFQKRAAPGEINWASLKEPLTYEDHPHAVKIIAARFRKDFPLECKAIDESSSERLPYYFDDLDLYHWGPKFLRRVIQCICEEKSMLHANILRFAVHLIATDAPRARQIAYLGRACWYHEEVAQYGGEFLEEVAKFMTHRDDVIQKLTVLANKYTEEAKGDSYMPPMYFDEVFKSLTVARAARLSNSPYKGPVLVHIVTPSSAPTLKGGSAARQIDNTAGTPLTSRAIEYERRGMRFSAPSGEISAHRRRTSSLGTEDTTPRRQLKDTTLLEDSKKDSSVAHISVSFNAELKSSESVPRGDFAVGQDIKEAGISTEAPTTLNSGTDDQANGSATAKGSNPEGVIAGPTDNNSSTDASNMNGAMISSSGNQQTPPEQQQSKHPRQKQPGTQQTKGQKSSAGLQKSGIGLKLDTNAASNTAIRTASRTSQEPGNSTPKSSKGKKNKNKKGRGIGTRTETRDSSSPVTFQPSSDHARKPSASRSILDEDDSIISVTIEGEKRISPNLAPQAAELAQVNMLPYGSQNYRTTSGSGLSGGNYQPRMAPWVEPQAQPSGYGYVNELSMSATHPWQRFSNAPAFQGPPMPPMPYMISQGGEMPYDADYQTQWAPAYGQPPMHIAGPSEQFNGGSFQGPALPFADQEYYQQPFNLQAGSFQQYTQPLQHYQHEQQYGSKENRKRFQENTRHSYDRFPNRQWNNTRGYRRDSSQNNGPTYGPSYDRHYQRNFQSGYNSSRFDGYNGTQAQYVSEQNHRVSNEHRGLDSLENSHALPPSELPGKDAAKPVFDGEASANITYPIQYSVTQPVPNTPVVSRELSASASPRRVQNKAICNVDLDAVNMELQVQSKAILSPERREKFSAQPEYHKGATEGQPSAAFGTAKGVPRKTHEKVKATEREAPTSTARSSSMTNGPPSMENKTEKRTLLQDLAQTKEDPQFPSLQSATTQAKSKHQNPGSAPPHKAKEAVQPAHAKQQQIGVSRQGNTTKTLQTGSSAKLESPKEVTTVVTVPAGRRSPSARIPYRNIISREDPSQLYVSGSGLDDIVLAKIFSPYQPAFMSITREAIPSARFKTDVPPNTRYAFVSFGSADKCSQVKIALSGQTREGVKLRVSSAWKKYYEFVDETASTTTTHPTNQHAGARQPSDATTGHVQEPHHRNTKADTGTKHKTPFSTGTNKGNASGNNSPLGNTGIGGQSRKASQKKDPVTTRKPAIPFSQPLDQFPELLKSMAQNSNKIVPAKPLSNKGPSAKESPKAAEVATTENFKPVGTELQSAAVVENNQPKDKLPPIKGSGTVSPLVADHPPVTGRMKKDKTKPNKKQKQRSKDLGTGDNIGESLSSSSSEFLTPVNGSKTSSVVAPNEGRSSPISKNEAEKDLTVQDTTSKSSVVIAEPEAMVWETTGSQSKRDEMEQATDSDDSTDQGFKTPETGSSDSNLAQLSHMAIDTAIEVIQIPDSASSAVPSDSSEETIRDEELPYSPSLVATNPRHIFLPSSSLGHNTSELESQERVPADGLVGHVDGSERMIGQYPIPLLVLDRPDTSSKTTDQLVSIESSQPGPVSYTQALTTAESSHSVGDTDTASPVKSVAADSKFNQSTTDTQGWDASVTIKDTSSQKKRRKSRRGSKNFNASGSTSQVGNESEKSSPPTSPNTSKTNGTGSPSPNKSRTTA